MAEVKDEFTDNTHYLIFLIPKVDKGDIGPQGLVGTTILDSYASLYEDNGNSYMLVANTPKQVEFSKNSQIKNMDISFTNTVKVLNVGIYKIDYFFSSVASVQSDISIELRKENITINGTKITKKVNNQEYVWFNGSIIVSLNKDEKINIEVPVGGEHFILNALCGATVGKYLGPDFAMKGGLGTYALQIGDLQVGAIVAVNCLGDVIDPDDNNKIIAGMRKNDKFMNIEQIMINNYDDKTNLFSGNTTIGAIVTNGKFNKSEMNKIASMAHNGYGRTMRPAHSIYDGDTIFTMSTGNVESDLSVVGMLSAKVMEKAVINAIKNAESLHGVKSYNDIK